MTGSDSVAQDRIAARLARLSIGVFFIGGFLTAIVGLLVPRVVLTLGLDYARALLIQLAFYSSYLLFAAPIAVAILRIGYMRGIAAGLLTMAAACALLVVAIGSGSFGLTLAALLLLSAGVTFLQIACNTVFTLVGSPGRAAARLTLLQGFNALGTVIGPSIGAWFLLGRDQGQAAAPFVAATALLLVLGALFVRHRDLLPPMARGADRAPLRSAMPGLLRDRRLMAGTIAIFAYVGAEVTIGTLLANFLMLPDVIAADPVSAGRMVGLYWAGAMIGRFAGAGVLRRVHPPLALFATAAGGIVLTVAAALLDGWPAAAALIAVGLCNAIMYPTIYALALPQDEATAPLASMLLCMAVVGGAIVPLLTGIVADAAGLAPAMLMPSACYVVVAGFALSCLREKK